MATEYGFNRISVRHPLTHILNPLFYKSSRFLFHPLHAASVGNNRVLTPWRNSRCPIGAKILMTASMKTKKCAELRLCSSAAKCLHRGKHSRPFADQLTTQSPNWNAPLGYYKIQIFSLWKRCHKNRRKFENNLLGRPLPNDSQHMKKLDKTKFMYVNSKMPRVRNISFIKGNHILALQEFLIYLNLYIGANKRYHTKPI